MDFLRRQHFCSGGRAPKSLQIQPCIRGHSVNWIHDAPCGRERRDRRATPATRESSVSVRPTLLLEWFYSSEQCWVRASSLDAQKQLQVVSAALVLITAPAPSCGHSVVSGQLMTKLTTSGPLRYQLLASLHVSAVSTPRRNFTKNSFYHRSLTKTAKVFSCLMTCNRNTSQSRVTFDFGVFIR